MGIWETLDGMLNGIGRIPIFGAISDSKVLLVLALLAFIFFVLLILVPFSTWMWSHVLGPIIAMW